MATKSTDRTKADFKQLLETYQTLSDKADAGTIQPPEVEKLKDIKKLLHDEAQKIIDSKTLYDELVELEPFIEEELHKQNTSFLQYFENYTFGELLEMEKDPESEFSKLLEVARKARVLNESPGTITIKGASSLDFPIDKINSNAWKLLELNTGGQIAFDMANLTDRKNNIKVPVFYSIDFAGIDENITITKTLTPYDKRVYTAIGTLFNAGNNVISLSSVYKHMGYKGRAGTTDLEKIQNSVLKMIGAIITLNNEQEIKKYNYSRFVYNGPLLPVEMGKVYNIKGALTDAAIHIFREPPLITFAAQRNQITKVSLEMLQSPISKTDANLLIEDYLIERIARAKRKTFKIKMEKLYSKTNTKTEKQRQRLPKKLSKLLDYYMQIGQIEAYEITKQDLIIHKTAQ